MSGGWMPGFRLEVRRLFVDVRFGRSRLSRRGREELLVWLEETKHVYADVLRSLAGERDRV